MVDDQRIKHPFCMYEHICAEPGAFATAVERNGEAVEDFFAQSGDWRQVLLVGIGTSYHAAQVGEHLMRAYGGGIPVRPWHSFDFVEYGPELSPDDCVVAINGYQW